MFAFVHRLNKCLPRASPRLSVLGPRRLWGRAGSARSGEALASPALWGRLPVCLGAWPLLAPGDPDRPRSSPVRLGPETARSGRSVVTAGLSNCRARLRHGMPLGGVLGPWQPPWVLEGGAPLTLQTSAASCHLTVSARSKAALKQPKDRMVLKRETRRLWREGARQSRPEGQPPAGQGGSHPQGRGAATRRGEGQSPAGQHTARLPWAQAPPRLLSPASVNAVCA